MAGMAFHTRAARIRTRATKGKKATPRRARGRSLSARHHGDAGPEGDPPPGPDPPGWAGGAVPAPVGPPVWAWGGMSLVCRASARCASSPATDGGSATIVVRSSAVMVGAIWRYGRCGFRGAVALGARWL